MNIKWFKKICCINTGILEQSIYIWRTSKCYGITLKSYGHSKVQWSAPNPVMIWTPKSDGLQSQQYDDRSSMSYCEWNCEWNKKKSFFIVSMDDLHDFLRDRPSGFCMTTELWRAWPSDFGVLHIVV